MAAAKVFVLVDGQRLTLHQTGADTVGAFAGFAPVGAEPKAGALENLPFGGRGDAVEDHAAGVGQQHRMAGAGELLMQAGHFVAGDVQHLLQAFAAFQDTAMFQHRRRHGQGRIEVIVLKAAQPGTGDGRIAAGTVQVGLALGDGQYLLGMATQMVVVHFLLFSPGLGDPVHEVMPSILQPGPHCNAGKTGRSQAVPQSGTKCHPGCTESVTGATRPSDKNLARP